MIDLHTHTTASDGTYSPLELLSYAKEKNLSALAITDHDTIDGLKTIANYLSETKDPQSDLLIINGIELSSNTGKHNFDTHILGLFLDINNPHFVSGLKEIIDDRQLRNEKMVSLLQKEGYKVKYEDLEDYAKGSVITRAHVAKVLIQKGYFNNLNEVFSKIIGNNGAAYVKRIAVSAPYAIDFIRRSGGIPVLAHPTLYGLDLNGLYGLIDELKSYGLMGIESYYSLYSKTQHEMVSKLAKRFSLLETGGSDFHGGNKPNIDLGSGLSQLNVPDSLLEPLLNAAKKLNNQSILLEQEKEIL